MTEITSVNPFRCRPWEFHDRLEQTVSESNCRAEIESFLKHGQLVPAVGRAIQGDPDYDIEIICGFRRLFVARHLNKPLLVELRQMSDAEAFIAMDIENRHRRDVSPYERGLSYLTCLRQKLYRSQEDIARALKVSPSQVSRLIKLAQLPSVIISAFRSPADLCESWAQDLEEVLSEPKSRERICARAREVAAMRVRPEPRAIMRELLRAAAPGRKAKVPQHDVVVTDRGGKSLFRIRHLANTIALILPVERMTANRLAQIRSMVVELLETQNQPGCETLRTIQESGSVRILQKPERDVDAMSA